MMIEKDYAALVAKNQSFSSESGAVNTYLCPDNWQNATIPANTNIYVLTVNGSGPDGLREGTGYFFDQATFDRFYDEAFGTFDAEGLSKALQVAPFPL